MSTRLISLFAVVVHYLVSRIQTKLVTGTGRLLGDQNLKHGPNGNLPLIKSWPPPPDNVHIDEHIHVSWQCWLRNHESSLIKGPFTSFRFHFCWSAISGYVSWLRASWWGAANPNLWKCVWEKIDYYWSGHWRTCIWPWTYNEWTFNASPPLK